MIRYLSYIFLFLAVTANASLRSDSLLQSEIDDYSFFEILLIPDNLGHNYFSSDIGIYVDDTLCKVEAKTGSPAAVYYHSDRQYNVRGLTNSSGDIVELYTYTPYSKQAILSSQGLVLAGSSYSNNQYGYAGRYKDIETGLWIFRISYFSAEMGRFVNRDRLGMSLV